MMSLLWVAINLGQAKLSVITVLNMTHIVFYTVINLGLTWPKSMAAHDT